MERYSDLQFRVFDWLRFPLIVGVVFIHCFGKSFDYEAMDFTHLTRMDCYNLFRVSISQVLTHVCVPTFYLISGYLFFIGLEKWNWKIYLNKLKKRSISLLVPFLIWNTLSILLAVLSAFIHEGWLGVQGFFADNNYGHLYWDCQAWNLDRTNLLGGGYLSTSPYLIPLWFLRDLMVVCVCSPLLFFLFKYTRIIGVVLLTLCYTTGVFFSVPGFSIMAFMFFGVGACLRMNGIDTTKLSYNYRKVIYAVTVILWIVCTMFNGHNTKQGDLIYPFYVIFGCLTTINIATYLVDKKKVIIPELFSNASFFIYLLHTILVISIVNKVAYILFGETNPILMTLSYLFVPVATVAICLLAYYILNKFTPKLLKVLTGDRSIRRNARTVK